MKPYLFIGCTVGSLLIACTLQAQTYLPVKVTGFNQDVVAETGTNVATATSSMIDGNKNITNHVMYSTAFARANSLQGGIDSSGTIVSGTHTWQMESFAGKNALYLSLQANIDSTLSAGNLTLSTPAYYSRLSLLLFSTEGNSFINIDLNYADGTSARAVTNASVVDWYFGANAVYQNFGRIQRDSFPPFTVDGVGANNPRMYSVDFLANCGSQDKLLKSVTITDTGNVNSTSSFFPRIVVMAVSGVPVQPFAFNPTVLPARCGSADNGIVTLNVTGGVKPFTYAWNTTPAQTTNVAAGLSSGTYSCTVTDSNGCVRTYTANVPLVTPAAVIANATKSLVCSGSATTLYADTTSAVAGTYTWTPGYMNGSAVSVSPTTATDYIVSKQDIYGCTSADTIHISVKPTPGSAFTVDPDAVCPNTPLVVTYTGTASATATWNWNNFAGAAIQSGTGQGPYNIVYKTGGTYTIQLQVTDNGCVSPVTSRQVSINGPLSMPVVAVGTATSTSIIFTWQPVPGATGYIVSINGGPYITPSSGIMGTSHQLTSVQPASSFTINVIALGVESCRNSAPGTATGHTLQDEIFIPNSFTPNNDGKNDVFRVYGNAIAAVTMKIFNQWGELIYEGNDTQGGWDGMHKGKVQPMGVYIYAIKIKLTNGAEMIRKGAVNLLH